MLMATTGDGWLVPLLITESGDGSEKSRISAGPLPNISEEQPIQFPCWFSSSDPSSGIVNTGGTGMPVVGGLTHWDTDVTCVSVAEGWRVEFMCCCCKQHYCMCMLALI